MFIYERCALVVIYRFITEMLAWSSNECDVENSPSTVECNSFSKVWLGSMRRTAPISAMYGVALREVDFHVRTLEHNGVCYFVCGTDEEMF